MAERGRLEGAVHRFTLRVYYEDTDAGGLVYHANYLKFVERARTEMLRMLGLDHGTLRRRYGLVFVVRRCTLDFLAPAGLDDVLEVETRLVRRGGASIDLVQTVARDGRPVVRAEVRLALLGCEGRAARLPGPLAEALAPLRPDGA